MAEDTGPPAGGPGESDVWLSVMQGGKRTGWAHRTLAWAGGVWRMEDVAFLRVNIMGETQDVQVITSAEMAPDLTLRSFTFNLGSDAASFSVQGEMKGGKLVLSTGSGPEAARTEIPFAKPPYLGGSLLYASEVAKLAKGEKRSFPIFDPATLGTSPAEVEVLGVETVKVMGADRTARKVKLSFMGSTQYAWIGEDGETLAEEGLLGMRLERADRESALALDGSDPGTDLVETASVAVNEKVAKPKTRKKLSLAVSGVEDLGADLVGGRQEWDGKVLTVTREALPPADYSLDKDPGYGDAEKAFLAPGPFIQSDHPDIVKKAGEIVSEKDGALARVKKITEWVHKHLNKEPVFSVPDAVATLADGSGDCNEHAVLTAALARAAGVPARMEVGLVYQKGRFYYHAWNAFWLGKWVTADTVFGQLPADVTHLRFGQGNPDAQLRIMGLLGRVKLSFPETKK